MSKYARPEAGKLVNAATVNLIKRCKKNDEDAYNQLVSQYEGYLYRTCYNFTRDREEALDMMQEVYIKIFKGLKHFDETRPLLPWMKTVTINTMINYSSKKRLPETSLNATWQQNAENPHSLSPEEYLAAKDNTEEQAVFSDTSSVIDRLIAQLPEAYRMALTLRYHEEMSYEQIASTLELPLGTAKNSVFRARTMLREKMQACELLEV
jgi:RNA polymerase sigma-70 factor, ECF subfamily